MKIAIAGFGVEGQANYAYWAQDPTNEIAIVDERDPASIPNLPDDVPVLTGSTIFQELHDFDLVIRTAGLSPYKIKTNGKVWSATNEFFAQCPAPIIGVTGSKGKGTTSSLIASILEAAGKKVWLVGNIGLPSLNVLADVKADDIVVYELSSFQLWDIERSPQVAVVLFIEQEHLDVHRDMDDYVQAKGRIAQWQHADDVLIYNANNQYAQHIAQTSAAQKIDFPSTAAAHIDEASRAFYYGQTKLCSVDELRLPGEHNKLNALAAISAVWPYTQDAAAIRAGLNAFSGLPHRLAYVATIDDVEYYDDSIATTPSSAIAALRAFENRSKIIILGGSSKGSDFSELADEMKRHNSYGLLIGDEATTIAQAFDAVGFARYEIVALPPESNVMQLVVERAATLANPGDVVLLSPSAASFGLFNNYADRGERFISAVMALATV